MFVMMTFISFIARAGRLIIIDEVTESIRSPRYSPPVRYYSP